MKPITKDSIIKLCLYCIGNGYYKKGLLINDGDSGIISMEGNVHSKDEDIDYVDSSDHTADDILTLLEHFANMLEDDNGPFEAKVKEPKVLDHKKRFAYYPLC